MASYVTTGFSKQLLVYTSYIFYVDPLIRETLSTVISYRKSSPSRPISSSIFCAPHSNLPRIPTLSYRNVIEALYIESTISTFLDLTQRARFVAILVNNSMRWWRLAPRPSYPPSVLLLWRSPWLTQSMTVTPTMTELFFDNESSPS